jgi:purine-cytosine permease-like protein
VSAGLWFSAVFYSVLFGVAIVGALKRWTWIYYVIVVLLGLSAISLPLDLFYLLAGVPHFAGVPTFSPPPGLYAVALVTGIPGAALFVFMLVALVKRGPWGMRRVA